MKFKIIAFHLLLFTSFFQTAFSQHSGAIHWISFEKAVELNKKNPKMIFIDVYTDWCGWCKKMDASTFSDPDIATYMNKNFYNVKFDAEGKQKVIYNGQVFINPNPDVNRSSHQLAVSLLQGKMSYPSYVFLNDKMELLTVVPGFMNVQKFEPIIKYFGEKAYLKKTWEEFNLTFKNEYSIKQ